MTVNRPVELGELRRLAREIREGTKDDADKPEDYLEAAADRIQALQIKLAEALVSARRWEDRVHQAGRELAEYKLLNPKHQRGPLLIDYSTYRPAFAGQALQGILSSIGGHMVADADQVATSAIDYADTLIEHLERTP